jgi:hypothetical protein
MKYLILQKFKPRKTLNPYKFKLANRNCHHKGLSVKIQNNWQKFTKWRKKKQTLQIINLMAD